MFPRFKFTFAFVLLSAALPFWVASPALASELVYTPINPSFGGNPNNAPGLMNIAQAQNGFTAKPLSPLESFNLSLQRAVLSRLTSQALNTMFGQNVDNPNNLLLPSDPKDTPGDPLPPKKYDTVGYTILITNTTPATSTLAGVLTITTTDKSTGAVATFEVGTPMLP